MSPIMPAGGASSLVCPNRRNGFTMAEAMILAIIAAVLAVTIVPQFSATTREAKTSALKFNLHVLRSQLEKYREDHQGRYPPAKSNSDFVAQLTCRTAATTAMQADGPCGPYIKGGMPANPFNDSSTVAIIQGATPPTAPTGSGDGWQYNPAQGWFYPNNVEYFRGNAANN